jgi:hypothetical protein
VRTLSVVPIAQGGTAWASADRRLNGFTGARIGAVLAGHGVTYRGPRAHPVDALSGEDAFACGDRVARQVDAMPDMVAVAHELGDGRRGHASSVQVAVDPWPVTSGDCTVFRTGGDRIADLAGFQLVPDAAALVDVRLAMVTFVPLRIVRVVARWGTCYMLDR